MQDNCFEFDKIVTWLKNWHNIFELMPYLTLSCVLPVTKFGKNRVWVWGCESSYFYQLIQLSNTYMSTLLLLVMQPQKHTAAWPRRNLNPGPRGKKGPLYHLCYFALSYLTLSYLLLILDKTGSIKLVPDSFAQCNNSLEMTNSFH